MSQKISIIGTGLIGGSLALAWKRNLPDARIVGCDRPEVLEAALAESAIDECRTDPAEAVRGADVVIIATPVRTALDQLDVIAPALKPGAVVSDVGSVKHPIALRAAERLPEGTTFIGGHPMAGAERGGFGAADPLLFENATYVLCPPAHIGAEEFARRFRAFVSLVEATGARTVVLEAERHDRIAAAVSHVPQLLAVTLMNHALSAHAEDDAVLRLAAGGFRDLTRIASSPFEMWRDIIATNAGPITESISAFRMQLEAMERALARGEIDAVSDQFRSAREARAVIPRNTKGFMKPLSDVYVYAEDRPGFLLNVTRILFDEDINIKDIELLKIREGTGGAFRIGFDSEEVAEAAVAAFRSAGLSSHRL